MRPPFPLPGRTSRRRVLDLVDVAVSWPGLTIQEAADELSVSLPTVKSYAAAGRRWGVLWSGYVPRLVDLPEGLVPDVLGARVSPFVRQVHTRIAGSWVLDSPVRLRDLCAEGMPRRATIDALERLRILGAVMPAGTLYATRDGTDIACDPASRHATA